MFGGGFVYVCLVGVFCLFFVLGVVLFFSFSFLFLSLICCHHVGGFFPTTADPSL